MNTVLNMIKFGNKKDLFVLEDYIRTSTKVFVANAKIKEDIKPYECLYIRRPDVNKFVNSLYAYLLYMAKDKRSVQLIQEYHYQVLNVVADIITNDRLRLNIDCGGYIYTSYDTFKCLIQECQSSEYAKSECKKLNSKLQQNICTTIYDEGSKKYGVYTAGYHNTTLKNNRIPYKIAVKFTEYLAN